MDRRAIYIIAAFALLTMGMFAAFSPGRGPAVSAPERFPGPWLESNEFPISRALAKSGISGCGEYRYKASRDGSGEYLVQCSRDGVTWRSYLVWPRIEKASGPFDENDLP